MKQQTLAIAADQESGFEQHRRPTRRDVFLATMEQIVPWSALCAVIEPHYPKAGKGRPGAQRGGDGGQRARQAPAGRPAAWRRAADHAIDGAEALFTAHGVDASATYDAQALEVQVGVLSSMGRRYLELIGKLDQLMPLLQTLEIHEIITTQALDVQRAQLKRQVRDVANAARSLAMGLRRRMNATAPSMRQAIPVAEPGGHGPAGAGGAPDDPQTDPAAASPPDNGQAAAAGGADSAQQGEDESGGEQRAGRKQPRALLAQT